MYVNGGVNRNNGLRNRIDENNRFRERKIPLFDGDAKRFLSFFIFPLIVKRVHRTVLVSPFELQALISILWPRPRCTTTKEVGCSCGEGFKLFSIDKKSRIHRWDKHTGKEYSNILFSFLFKNFLVRYLREIIEEIIRYTRRRYLKDCSTLCSSITGSRDFNNGELRLVEYQYWYPPPPPWHRIRHS